MLSLLNRNEVQNFVGFLKRNPQTFFTTSAEFVALTLKGIRQRVTHALIHDKHKLDKTYPKNLFQNELAENYARQSFHEVTLPQYTLSHVNYTPPLSQSAPYEVSDIEAYYAENRWMHCIEALFGDLVQAQEAVNKCLKWITDNIPKTDRAWECYSACERVANLSILISTHRVELSDAAGDQILKFLRESLVWIDAHLEHYHDQRTNNHILNNARAIIIASVICGNSTGVERGLLLFDRMSESLFMEKGFLRERSSHYQIIVTGWLMDSIKFAETDKGLTSIASKALRNLKLIAEKVNQATSSVLFFLEDQMTHIGDISPDMSPVLSTARLELLYSIGKGSQDEQASLIDNWIFIKTKRERLISNIPFNKYPLSFTNHGHNDLGSFVWYHDNEPVLVDSGRYNYTTNPVSLNQIGGFGHNTLTINNLSPLADSLKINGAWFPEKYADANIAATILNKNEVLIEHSGFKRINGVSLHMRKVTIEDSVLHFEDYLDGSSICEVKLNWHLGPGFKKHQSTDTKYVSGPHTLDIVSLCESAQPEIITYKYELSSMYGHTEKAERLEILYKVQLPVRIYTTLKMIR